MDEELLTAVFRLKTCLSSVLAGEFKTKRYDPEGSAHLSELFENHREVLDKWKQSLEPVRLVGTGDDRVALSYPDFLDQKLIGDSHLSSFSSDCPSFNSWLKDRAFPVPRDFHTPLEGVLFELCKDVTDESAQIETLRTLDFLLRRDYQGTEFINDIDGLLKQLTKKDTTEPMEVANVDTLEELFLCGSEVLGSCQRVDGTPDMNKCLIAYFWDGKNRILVVRSVKTGKIEARSIFRLLFKDGIPVLFQDLIYPIPCNPIFADALQMQAQAEAKRMGLDLYTINKVKGVEKKSVLLKSLAQVQVL